MAALYILDVPEFFPLVRGLREAGLHVEGPTRDYYRISAPDRIVISRKALGLKYPIWFGALTGGLEGRIAQFDRNTLEIVDP